MTPDEYARSNWQSASGAGTIPTIDVLRARTESFRRTIWRRNLIEYVAGALVIAGFSFTLVAIPLPLMKVASALIIAGTVYVLWQLRRRAGNLASADYSGAVPVLVHQRASLVRQRDALEGVFWWYILPFLPGMALFFAAPVLAFPPDLWSEGFVRVVASAAILLAIMVGTWWINQRAARTLQAQIEEIDALLSD